LFESAINRNTQKWLVNNIRKIDANAYRFPKDSLVSEATLISTSTINTSQNKLHNDSIGNDLTTTIMVSSSSAAAADKQKYANSTTERLATETVDKQHHAI
jgi:hypothetical protein